MIYKAVLNVVRLTKGAIALVEGKYYTIGIPECQFDLDRKHFIAMSTEASILPGAYG